MQIPWMAVAVAIAVNSLWGGNPVAVKFGLEAFPPFWTAFLRFSLGTVCIGAWAAAIGVGLRPRPEEWRPYFGLSLLFGVQIWLMNVGFAHTSGTMGAVLLNIYPLVAAMLGHWLIPGDRLNAVRLLGLAVAFAGAATVLLGESGAGVPELYSLGNWILILSGSLLGLRLIVSARIVRVSDPARTTFWQMVLAQPWFLAGALATETVAWEAVGWRPVAGILYQGVVIAGLGFMTVAHLLKHYPPSTMLSFGFVAPLTGVALSAWLLREDVTPGFVAGSIGVMIGLVLVLREPGGRRGGARGPDGAGRGR